ncbi:hypothetical protein SERLADRAFT_382011 [Serpula lacrymans var. lacrymans S7.9]|uniref:Uncharacterized protein n=1 Tax=Serpula lacrymans var. lacrymans (strain S7.9) TaxID=578457 RepID=F8NM99_SERL9|nr:uncharacterized protein SERLADRAFT_382011 [Serpula lacrymans var. lacrymans S7.9]EGO27349.1 hypothetical protein SERLADRAFT_382011 [Serpula lacrymans var. lacrymans S7.9]
MSSRLILSKYLDLQQRKKLQCRGANNGQEGNKIDVWGMRARRKGNITAIKCGSMDDGP